MPNSRRLFGSLASLALVVTNFVVVPPANASTPRVVNDDAVAAQAIDDEKVIAEVAIPKGAMVHPGRKRAVIVELHNTGRRPAANPGVHVQVPRGVRVTTKTKNWSCGERTNKGVVTCRHAFTLAGESSEELDLVLRTTKGTPPSVSELKVTPFTSSLKKTVAKSSPFTVIDEGDPVMVPHVQHHQGAEKGWVEWVDGSVEEAFVNEDYTYRVRVRNEGYVSFPEGESIRISQKVGKGVEFKKAKVVVAGGSCDVKTKSIVCQLTSKSDIAPGKLLGSVDVTLRAHRAQEKLPLGQIKLYEPIDNGRRFAAIVMKGIHRPEALTIEAHPRIDADAGGKGVFDLRLDNGKNGLTHSSYTVRAKLPSKLRFVRVSGKEWSCGVKDSYLICRYDESIAPGKRSSVARITYRALTTARVGEPSYSLEFRSAHAVAFMHILVRPALTVSADASHEAVRTSSNKSRNHVLLIGDITSDGESHVHHKWLQRCTTLLDTRRYEGCTPGLVTPKAKIAHSGHSRTQAILPHVTKRTEFVFEYLAYNESTEAHRTVKVLAVDANATSASVSQSGIGVSAGSSTTISLGSRKSTTTLKKATSTPAAQVTTYSNVVPQWIYDALRDAHIDSSKVVNVNNVVSFSEQLRAKDVLTVAMQTRLAVDADEKVYLTALGDDPTTCPVLAIGDTKAWEPHGTILALGMAVLHIDYIMPSQSCKFHDETFTSPHLQLNGGIFGSIKQFSGPVTWSPQFKFVGSLMESSWTIGKGDSALTLRNVGYIITLDDATGSTTLGFNTGFAVFGTTLNLTGAITAPVSAGGVFTSGMMVSASLSSPQAFSSGEVKVRNLALTLAVRWTPALSANRAWNDSALSDIWISVIGSGEVEFLGTTLRFDKIEADFLAGALSRIQFTVNANMNLPGMRVTKGDITIVWMAGFPANPTNTDLLGRSDPVAATPPGWSVKASMIFESEHGFSIGTEKNPATLTYSGACVSISGQVIVNGVLDATVNGFLITGFPCVAAYVNIGSALMKTQGHVSSILDTLPMPLVVGDWRFDATNVKINIAGTTVTGNFSIGRVLQVPFGAIDATLQLGKSATNNVIKVQGAINPVSGFTLKGSGNLDVAGMVLNFNVDAAMTVTEQHIHATADLKVGGTSVILSGDFEYQKAGGVPIPTAKFSAEVNGLTIDGYGLGKAKFSLEQGLGTGGVAAALDINLGFLKASGAASFHTVKNGIVMSIDAVGSLGVPDKFTADVSVHATNCATEACDSLGILQVKATGSVTLQGKNFNLASVEFDSAGHFKITTKHKADSCSRSKNIGGVQYQGCFGYSLEALISDSSPYVKFDADVKLEIESRIRDSVAKKWSKWDSWGKYSAGIDVEFDPFKMSFRVGSIKVTFSGS